MPGKITILHISDTHFGHPSYQLDANTVIKPLKRDIEEQTALWGWPDLVVFNGDLAFGELSAAPLHQQYKMAGTFLQNLTKDHEIPLLIVPGNHDINRDAIDEAQVRLMENLSDADVIYRWMEKRELTWRRMLERQKEWADFRAKLPNSFEFDDSLMLTTGTIKVNSNSIGVLGLNTSWACTGDRDDGHLWIGKYQWQKGMAAFENAEFIIAAGHHPISWLHPEERTWMKQKLEESTRMYLHGHIHDTWFTPIEHHLEIAAGACYQGSTKPNGYNWITLNFDESKTTIALREFVDKGTGGWRANEIPGKTDGSGHAHIMSPFGGEKQLQGPEKINVIDEVLAVGALQEVEGAPGSPLLQFIKVLEDNFHFRWEPSTFGMGDEEATVYWPVRLRPATPIHAVQAFAAAGLMRAGAKVVLCLDDFGNAEEDAETFVNRVSQWMDSVSGNSSELEVHKFSVVLGESQGEELWRHMQSWLTSRYDLGQVLHLAKLLPSREIAGAEVSTVWRRRPRSILTPALVWSFLKWLALTRPPTRVLTLGGYDERNLWNVWRDVSRTLGIDINIGHVYVPELHLPLDSKDAGALQMSVTPLAWDATEDIRKAFQTDINTSSAESPWYSANRMVPWCFTGCVLLPSFIAGVEPNITLGGVKAHSATTIEAISPGIAGPAIAEAVAKWYF